METPVSSTIWPLIPSRSFSVERLPGVALPAGYTGHAYQNTSTDKAHAVHVSRVTAACMMQSQGGHCPVFQDRVLLPQPMTSTIHSVSPAYNTLTDMTCTSDTLGW